MTDKQVGGTLIDSLTTFVNLVLAGKTPESVRPVFFGASLLAFNKKDGGVRPIAVGHTLRRLVAKVACRVYTNLCTGYLKPRQLGVGIKGGAEALVHAARRFVSNMPESHVFVKLDFTNAFNSIRRDCVREAVAAHAPGLLFYFDSAYGEVSNLYFGKFTIHSAEGVQQGDPLGPLLFCLTIQPILEGIKSDFVSGYLDDIGIGGDIDTVIDDLRLLDNNSKQMGLSLNHHKCEVYGLNLIINDIWRKGEFNFQEQLIENATLLGSPIYTGKGVDEALVTKRQDLDRMVQRLALLPAHAAMFLLKNAFAIPKLLYLLRTAPCFNSSELASYDDSLKKSLIFATKH